MAEVKKKLQFTDMSIQANILTATTKTAGLKVKGKIALKVDKETAVEGVIISKLGTQVKVRITNVITDKKVKL